MQHFRAIMESQSKHSLEVFSNSGMFCFLLLLLE
jgi:hypothetical protein